MRTPYTHGELSPNGLMGWVSDGFRPIPDHLRLMLGHLNGEEKYTYIIWRGADSTSTVGYREPATESFIQAAGSADGITVEVRLPGADGQGRLYTVGRPEPADEATRLIPINDERAVRVFSNEVFTADEAAAIFYGYYLTDTVAQPYVLRELDLSRELSENRHHTRRNEGRPVSVRETHAEKSPSGHYGFVTDGYRPIPDQLRLMLGHLNGEGKFSYIIWRAENPEKGFVTPQDMGDSFMQAAGSADGITVEVRLPGADGQGHLYTVGRPEPADGTTTLIPINDERAVRVFSNEVFTADEAAAIFYTYYLTDTVSQPYVLRELDLSQELSERR